MKQIQDNEVRQKVDALLSRYASAKKKRSAWETLWEECYDFALPQRGGFFYDTVSGEHKTNDIYDATAMDAADQLASSLMGHLTPIFTPWFGLKPGPEMSEEDAQTFAPALEKAGKIINDHFDRSNFAVEIHQCFLDLVVGGTASLFFEETQVGEFSAFKFTAAPLTHMVLEEGANGALNAAFREMKLTYEQLTSRYPDALIPPAIIKRATQDPQSSFKILEAFIPEGLSTKYHAILMEEGEDAQLLTQGQFDQSPVINFRWSKAPGESYGRSPVMKALPDIKTANKVVELVLKNASISVTGIWQADDDGVLNPANIELVPGSIIPKAVGSKGLQPLDMPSDFNLSQLVLENLQSRIRHALLADRLGPVNAGRMTATEVLERSAEVALILGATYGRLQSELLTPLIKRAFAILKRRGEIPDIELDGRMVMIDYRSPIARNQGKASVQNTLSWINSTLAIGAQESIDLPAAAKYLGEALGVPSDLIKSETV
ncbi:MAG: portal protein [Alphaproteobacteria bacterium]